MKWITALKIGVCWWLPIFGWGQDTLLQKPADTTRHTQIRLSSSRFMPFNTGTDSLQTVGVRAFNQNKALLQTPTAVALVDSALLERFGNTSLLFAFNTQPGIKMEERSPGSYRLNIRGSSLRAPFGVRNVKVYLNDMIFTDPSGGTYLNQLGFYNVASAEILKGPAGSMYGAGTGGALLLQTEPVRWQPGVEATYTTGSYNLQQAQAKVSLGGADRQNVFSFQRQTSDGYRDQSAMRRDVATYESRLRISDKQKLSVLAMYGDLYYQTPGGLTLAQYQANPKAARPRAGTQPSAQEAQAAIYQKTVYMGIANEYQLTDNWKNTTSVYGAFTWFNNPGIRVYEKRTEPHAGARMVFSNQIVLGKKTLNLVYGAEGQKGIFTVNTYRNKSGNPDTLQTNDEVNNWQYNVFAQADLVSVGGWTFTAGANFNKTFIGITRLNRYPVMPQNRSFGDVVSPRLAILKSWRGISVYGLVSQGFSPPTTSELIPGNGSINTTLNAERGWNYELGTRGNIRKLYYDVNVYRFRLQQAISQRRDASGNDFFVNTGGTNQQGIEALVRYAFVSNPIGFLNQLSFSGSYALQDFTYRDYKVVETVYNGNRLPGNARNYASLLLDATLAKAFYLNATYTYSDKIYLNDANTDVAAAYQLLALRTGWKKILAHHELEIFIGGDNLLNEKYSLGNDINAAVGRYYNAAPGRNYFLGIGWKWRK